MMHRQSRTGAAAAPPTIQVDWTRCEGHGLCAAFAPDAITLDPWGYPIIAPDATERARPADLRRAVAGYPALALRR
jgi:ferredoxin